MIPIEAPTRRRNWNTFNGRSLVDVIDQLYREHIDHSKDWYAQRDDSWGSRADREDVNRRYSDWWWDAYGPALGERLTAEISDLPHGRDHIVRWAQRYQALHNEVAPLLAELYAGTILVEADGDHTLEFQRVVVPIGLWRAANWMLYRRSPHDRASPRLVARDLLGRELPPNYYNPRLIIPRRGTTLTGNVATASPPEHAEAGSPRAELAESRQTGLTGTRGIETPLTPPAEGSDARPKSAPGAAPETRNWTETQIREEARVLYKELADDPPNINRAEQLLRERLPGAKRTRIRPVLRNHEFANLRRLSGVKRRK
jgi:hypothetical protein